MITDTTRRQQYDISSSVPATFAFSFWWYVESEFFAIVTLSTGVSETLVNGVDYELTDPGEGGTLTRLTDWNADAVQLTLYRETPFTQDVDFRNGDISDAEVHEAAHDRVVAMIQENEDNQTRTLLAPVSDPVGLDYNLPAVSLRANQYLCFRNDGTPDVSAGTAATGTVNALQLGGRLPGHGDEEIPISDDVVNSHLYAGRAALADEATHALDSDTSDTAGLATRATDADDADDAAKVNGHSILTSWQNATYINIAAGAVWYPPRGFYYLVPNATGLVMQIVLSYTYPISFWSPDLTMPVPGFLASPNSDTDNCLRIYNPTGASIRINYKSF